MDSTDTDKGISDVMSRQLTLDSPPHNGIEQTENSRRRENGTHSHGSEPVGNNTANSDDKEHPEIDLSDPDQVIGLLETVDLSEEDTECLLQEAYSMNKKLKEMLRRQEQSSPNANRSVKQRVVDRSMQSSNTAASSQGSRAGSASMGPKTPLPPIKKESTSIYAVKLRRSRTTVQDTGMSPATAFTAQRSKSKTKSRKKEVLGVSQSQKRPARSKTTEPRPEWNDRFNFT